MRQIRPIALSADEAAKALGITRNAFDSEVAPSLDWFELDGRELVSYAALERWLADRARGPEIRTKGAP